MASNNFRVNIVLRVLLLAILVTATVLSVYKFKWIVTPVILSVIIVATVSELIRYVERTNKEFTNFLLSIKSSDFSKYSTKDKRGQSFSDVKKAFNIIIDEFQLARIDKLANYTFLQTVVEHLNTAIISFDHTGEIKLINEAAKTLLHLPYLKNIYSLQQTDARLCDHLTHLQTGNNPVLEITIRGEKLKLSVRSTDFKIQGIEHKLVSIQNIKSEIEHTELEAWEQLLHVLTHEIMNSITPLSSLSATLKSKTDRLLREQQFDAEAIDDLSEGLNVIAKRSSGLVNFVNHYKSFITPPDAEFKTVETGDLLERVIWLKQEELKARGIILTSTLKKELLPVTLDAELVEQVLLNLVNNAADALQDTPHPEIILSADSVNNKTVIRVSDNGVGIEKDVLDKIFIPFFTTKTNGSGIGLSLSKQIMRLHGGSISVHTAAGEGTVFSLEFP